MIKVDLISGITAFLAEIADQI